jgi:hypothetical protein
MLTLTPRCAGMLELYDAPQSLPCVAPRALLIANGELDARCHMPGVLPAIEAAQNVGDHTSAAVSLHAFLKSSLHRSSGSEW